MILNKKFAKLEKKVQVDLNSLAFANRTVGARNLLLILSKEVLKKEDLRLIIREEIKEKEKISKRSIHL